MTCSAADLRAPTVAAPEWELLLRLAERGAPPERLDEARHIAGGAVDWRIFVELALRHRVAPLVREHVRALGRGVAPTQILAELDRHAMIAAARNLVLLSELGEIAEALAARELRVLAYKGPVVSLAAYGSPLLRPMRDLDLLVDPRDFRAVERVLAARGYRRLTGVLWRRLQRLLEYQCCFTRDEDGALVELHWTLMPRNICRAVGLDELWERRRETVVAGRAIPCLAAEDRLLSLCVHGSKHRWSRLEWIACIAALLRKDAPDWDVLRRRASEWRVQRMLRLSLLVAGTLLDAPIPDEVRRWAGADAAACGLASDALRHLPPGRAGSDDDDAALKRFHLRAQDRPRQRIRYHVLSPMIHTWRAAAQLSNVLTSDGV